MSHAPLPYLVYATILAHQPQADRPVASQDIYTHLTSQGVALPDGALEATLMELVARGRIAVTHSPNLSGASQHGALLIRLRTDGEQPAATLWSQIP